MHAKPAATFRRMLRRLRYGLVLGLLLIALMMLNVMASCVSAEDPVPLYGPPPDTGAEEDGRAIDVISPSDSKADGEPRVLYGPPPVDAVAGDVPQEVQDVMQPPPPYGPPPLDIVDDSMTVDVPDIPHPPPPYGPLPYDTIHDTPPPTDCEPGVIYGPQPCDSDAACVESYGEGWYCDEENSYSDGCGGTIEWPVCKQD